MQCIEIHTRQCCCCTVFTILSVVIATLPHTHFLVFFLAFQPFALWSLFSACASTNTRNRPISNERKNKLNKRAKTGITKKMHCARVYAVTKHHCEFLTNVIS